MPITHKPLRILVVVNLPWDSRLGATRVLMELAEQWRAAGHLVEKYSLSDPYPDVRATSARFTLRQLFFSYRAAAFIRKNRDKFDVIDALIGVLPFSKRRLGFHGLLVARSVGLYRLYEEFDRSVEKRWPGRPKGKFLGRIFYALSRCRFSRAADQAVRHADLINLPNEAEAACLRAEVSRDLPILVQPYGLTEARRRALHQSAAPAEVRLAQKRICFIGMWSPRKGARDWSGIIARIRADVPEAQFRFLGTMIDSKAILSDLQLKTLEGIEFVSEFQPDDLPELLADCTVGAFPSYAEGFGLAVLEQMAAGLPTIAYDTAGPHDLLAPHLPELLVPKGDLPAFAGAISGVLRLDPDSYEKLSARGVGGAIGFSWPAIAEATLDAYRHALGGEGKILFVQPFSLGSAGGGARILRALLEGAPFAWQSVCTLPRKPTPWPNEIHLPSRPAWGRIEHSRFAPVPNVSAPFFAPIFRRRLKEHCERQGVRAIHAVPHAGLDFAQVHAVARELALPFFISLHDDLAYTAAAAGAAAERESAMRVAWQEASARFVISEALGREYCERYGARDYQVVTDGLSDLTPPRRESGSNELRIYFMGLFHMGYERNLRALLDGLALFERDQPKIAVRVTCRCEHIRAQVLDGAKNVTVLPFANEAQVRADMETADLLYLPIPFGESHENFARYSLSTKMVTYAGSGVPILYHGPPTSAAFDLLNQNNAAVFLTSLAPTEIAATLAGLTTQKLAETSVNALALAAREFMLADQTRKFWGAFSGNLSPA
ncbi:MAG: glycosyltransferase [Verrucomicrobiota bacterium]|nr:glycosyltransferase [Verrucomicrobiota bacterium]